MKDNVLIISPHLDNGNLGCGGTIVKLVQSGFKVHYISFSVSDDNCFNNSNNKNDLKLKNQAALKILGVSNFILENFPNQKLNQHRQEILEILISLKKSLSPKMVFMPASLSIHQDHKVIFQEGIRAFKHTSCYGYDLPWDTDTFKTMCFFVLNSTQLALKIKSVNSFKSKNNNIYSKKEFLKGLARVRGKQINVEFAEAFEVIRYVF